MDTPCKVTTQRRIGRVELIELSDGWRGRVSTGEHDAVAGSAAPSLVLPGVDEWRKVLDRLIADPSSMPSYTVLKHSSRGEIIRASVELGNLSLPVVAKRFALDRLAQRLSTMWVGSPARRNFLRARSLRSAGINTALPLAYLERRRPQREAWLITQFVDDLVDLDQVVLGLLSTVDAGAQSAVKRRIIDAVTGLLVALRTHGLSHRDFKASNILLADWDGRAGGPTTWLVDLDGLKPMRVRTARRRRQPVVRLAASLSAYAGVTRTDLARFIRRYLAALGFGDDSWKQCYRRIARASARYVRHARRRKHFKLDGYTGDD